MPSARCSTFKGEVLPHTFPNVLQAHRRDDDVEALAFAGLLERDGRAVQADYDAIESSFRFEGTRRSA